MGTDLSSWGPGHIGLMLFCHEVELPNACAVGCSPDLNAPFQIPLLRPRARREVCSPCLPLSLPGSSQSPRRTQYSRHEIRSISRPVPHAAPLGTALLVHLLEGQPASPPIDTGDFMLPLASIHKEGRRSSVRITWHMRGPWRGPTHFRRLV